MTASAEGRNLKPSQVAGRVVTYCAGCDALETMHEVKTDGTRGKRLGGCRDEHGQASSGVACPGYEPGRIEERLSEDELRRRLEAVVALAAVPPLRPDALTSQAERAWCDGWDTAVTQAVRAARGEL